MSDVEIDWETYFNRVELEINSTGGAVNKKNIALRMAKFIISTAVPDDSEVRLRAVGIIEEVLKEWIVR